MKKMHGLMIAMSLLAAATATSAMAQDYNREGDRHRDPPRTEDRHYWGDRQQFDRDWRDRGGDWDHEWRRGERLPEGYWRDQRYRIDDYRYHHLPRPRRG